jgi:hypothetical protein
MKQEAQERLYKTNKQTTSVYKVEKFKIWRIIPQQLELYRFYQGELFFNQVW